jgi:hypothetical protein
MSQIESDQIVGWAPRDTDDARFLPSTSLGCPICSLIRHSPTIIGDRVGVLWPHLRRVHVFSSSAEAITSETIARTSSSVVR